MDQYASRPAAVPAAIGAWPRHGEAGCDDSYLHWLIQGVDDRRNGADHRALLLIKNLLANGNQWDAAQRAEVERCLTGFRYDMTEPGKDSMRMWSEDHVLTFAVAEYLAGRLFPDQTFTNDGRSGERHLRSAETKLQVWLSDRFRFGFSEWLSNTCYAWDAGALALLIDEAQDATMVASATIVLDLLMFDLALHNFQGTFAPAMACAGAEQQRHPERAEVQPVLASAFGETGDDQVTPDITQLASLFVCRRRYQVPETISEIAHSDQVVRARTSQGLDVAEVASELRAHPEFPRTQSTDLTKFYWGMQALITPESIAGSVAYYTAHGMDNQLLPVLERFRRIPRQLLASSVRSRNPVASGMALQRGNVQTYRSPNYLLSSAQYYHPGEFGGQQHLWHASLPGGVSVFGTHPGESRFRSDGRPVVPSRWVGNGINPTIGQHDNVLLVSYDLTVRGGYLEGKRQHYAHLYVPFVEFDETRMGVHWMAGRRGASYLGIIGLPRLELVSESEIVLRGDHPAYMVVLSDEEEATSLRDFIRQLRTMVLSRQADELRLTTPYGDYVLSRRGLQVAGVRQELQYPRYDCMFASVPRNPSGMEIRGTRHRLVLDWPSVTRIEESFAE